MKLRNNILDKLEASRTAVRLLKSIRTLADLSENYEKKYLEKIRELINEAERHELSETSVVANELRVNGYSYKQAYVLLKCEKATSGFVEKVCKEVFESDAC